MMNSNWTKYEKRGLKRVYAGIVTCNPDLDRLTENINAIYPQVESVVIADNGLKNLDDIKSLARKYKYLVILPQMENKGIAAALNILAEWGLDHEMDWMLSLDQDSVAPEKLVPALISHVDADTACIAPHITYRNNEKYQPAVQVSDSGVMDVDWVITSACLTRLDVWIEIGGFDEWLFIDKVDYDYCLRARKAGYKVLECPEVNLLHELGRLHCRKILGKTIYVTNHSGFRKYYMVRNCIYLKAKLQQGHPAGYISKLVIKTLIWEPKKQESLKAICRGIRDGEAAVKRYKTVAPAV